MYATVVVTIWGRQMEQYNFTVEKQGAAAPTVEMLTSKSAFLGSE